MTMISRRTFGAGLVLLAGGAAQAQSYPVRPIKWVVPWAAGGSTDVLARIIAHGAGSAIGQSIVIENRAGATGTIGHAAVAMSAPDGYTWLLGTNSTFGIAPHLLPSIPYNHDATFDPVMLVAATPLVLCANKAFKPQSVGEIISAAKHDPGVIAVGSGGVGTTSHLAAEFLMSATGIRLTHVPYRGGGPNSQGLVGGEISLAFLDLAVADPLVQSGFIRVLATTGSKRSQLFAAAPTMAEAGVAGYEVVTSYSLFAPKGVPEAIRTAMNKAIRTALGDPSLGEKFKASGTEIVAGGPADLARHVKDEYDRWGTVIRERKIKL